MNQIVPIVPKFKIGQQVISEGYGLNCCHYEVLFSPIAGEGTTAILWQNTSIFDLRNS